jgi:hypothetical protein
MAAGKSIIRSAAPSEMGAAGHKSKNGHRARRRGGQIRGRGASLSRRLRRAELLLLEQYALGLRFLYSVVCTARLALLHQRGEQDQEIADCLEQAVLAPMLVQMKMARMLVRRFGGRVPKEFP